MFIGLYQKKKISQWLLSLSGAVEMNDQFSVRLPVVLWREKKKHRLGDMEQRAGEAKQN